MKIEVEELCGGDYKIVLDGKVYVVDEIIYKSVIGLGQEEMADILTYGNKMKEVKS